MRTQMVLVLEDRDLRELVKKNYPQVGDARLIRIAVSKDPMTDHFSVEIQFDGIGAPKVCKASAT